MCDNVEVVVVKFRELQECDVVTREKREVMYFLLILIKLLCRG